MNLKKLIKQPKHVDNEDTYPKKVIKFGMIASTCYLAFVCCFMDKNEFDVVKDIFKNAFGLIGNGLDALKWFIEESVTTIV